jgi:large subunit ribosomal protein L22
MEAKAIHRYIGSSPRKMRLVIDLIKGMSVEKAIEVLAFSTQACIKRCRESLRSAISNLMNKDESSKHESDFFVKEALLIRDLH